MDRKFKFYPVFIDDMGSIAPFNVSESRVETKEENALWTVNSMRRHDGLPEWTMEKFINKCVAKSGAKFIEQFD